jgi:capsular polysaccharide biosynthesis protein
LTNSEVGNSGLRVDDEIDLIDLFMVLWKRKLIVVIIFILFILAGFIYVFTSFAKYEYITSFEVGSVIRTHGEEVEKLDVESPLITRAKIDDIYIPRMIVERYQENGDKLSVKSSLQKDSNIILLSSVGTEGQQEDYQVLHSSVVAPIIESHQKTIAASKKEYELLVKKDEFHLSELMNPKIFAVDEMKIERSIKGSNAKIKKISDEIVLLADQKRRLSETQVLLTDQKNLIEKNLSLSYANLPRASKEVDDETKALTFLMLNSQIDQNESRLFALKERISIEIEDKKKILDNLLLETQRNLSLQENEVSELQASLVKLRAQREGEIGRQQNAIEEVKRKIQLYQDSEVLSLAQRSMNTNGPGKSVVLLLSAMLGLMLGIMFAFATEFIVNVRHKQKAQGGV